MGESASRRVGESVSPHLRFSASPAPLLSSPPLILFEDDHLLVVNKPAGWNTHAPAPYAGEGLYDWLRHREPRWAGLAIIHRLDKETSGVLVFGKSAQANRSLTGQFATRSVRKTYALLSDRAAPADRFTATSSPVRVGERYLSRPVHAGGRQAMTQFAVRRRVPGYTELEAEPLTGRTHQVRVHAADRGLPILGDTLYGGSPGPRVCLHAESITLRHPVTGEVMTWHVPADFEEDPALAMRRAFIEPGLVDAYRLIHGASDGWPGWYVDRLGDWLLSQSERSLSPEQLRALERLCTAVARPPVGAPQAALRGACHKRLTRQVRHTPMAAASPQRVFGEGATDRFTVLENGLHFELSFAEGYSVGLFLDQRENRRRFLVNHVATDFPLFPNGPVGAEVLNTFAYTCGFSVCAAQAGARVTSVDLSKKYLEWGRRNFALNGLDPTPHDFIYGDAFDWLRRLGKKSRRFDVIILDPPTFSQSKAGGVFRVEQDYGRLVAAAMPLLTPDGVLFASANATTLKPEEFVRAVEAAVAAARREVVRRHYAPQPPDFPISRAEPAHLKTAWWRIR